MQMKLLADGNDGHRAYKAGDTFDGDSEWARRMLINGLAAPIDARAKEIAASDLQKARYGSTALASAAAEQAKK
jgi:hypothetical protein